MPISERLFLGEVPQRDPELLSGGLSVVSQNTKLQRGSLQPWRSPSFVATPTKAGVKKTIYRFDQASPTDTQFWFTWTTDVDCVKAPIAEDTTERTYFTGDGYPKKTDNVLSQTGGTDYPVAAYRLGVPQPDTTAVTVTVSGSPVDATESTLVGAYVLTYVTSWGEESAPGEHAIGTFEFLNGQTMTLDALPVPPSGNWNIATKRLYRSNTGTAGTAQYQFVDEIPAAQTTYADTKKNEDLQDMLATTGWFEPPDDGFGLTLGANGNAVMLSGRTIYCAQPYALYAWPTDYQLSVDSDLVGAGAFDQGFAILTKSFPYVLTGVDPSGYTLSKLPYEQACVSKRSIISAMGGVLYASPNGLWQITSSGCFSMTEKLLTKDQWQSYNPASMHCHELDGRVYCFYDNGVTKGCLIFDFGHDAFMTESDQWCDAAYNDPLRDALYLSQNGDITKWDGGAPLNYIWRSQMYRNPRYVSYGYGKVDAETYPVTVSLYGDQESSQGNVTQVLIHQQVVTSPRPFRLPPFPTRRHQFEVTGNVTVRGVAFAGNGAEIVQV